VTVYSYPVIPAPQYPEQRGFPVGGIVCADRFYRPGRPEAQMLFEVMGYVQDSGERTPGVALRPLAGDIPDYDKQVVGNGYYWFACTFLTLLPV
jgi:hypothetical protein